MIHTEFDRVLFKQCELINILGGVSNRTSGSSTKVLVGPLEMGNQLMVGKINGSRSRMGLKF